MRGRDGLRAQAAKFTRKAMHSSQALQHLMQHRDYQTTKRYINIARQLNPSVEKLYVPDVPAKPAAQRS